MTPAAAIARARRFRLVIGVNAPSAGGMAPFGPEARIRLVRHRCHARVIGGRGAGRYLTICGGEGDLVGDAGLYVADEAVDPEVDAADLDVIAAGFEQPGYVEPVGRLPGGAGERAV